MKDTDLKHLTLKTAFLLALASGKCHSGIHAWVANEVSNLGQWEKVALFPSSDFIAKNHLARVQVKAHDIRAFAASKAFYGGVLVDQIMQACHWKAHNTFINFYLKKFLLGQTMTTICIWDQ